MAIELKLTSIRINPGVTGENVSVTIKPKFSDARKYSLPRACIQDLMADLQALDIPYHDQTKTGSDSEQANVTHRPASVRMPKKWMVASGLPEQKLVFLVFDPRTEAKASFALAADAALNMANGLMKYALAIKTSNPNQEGSNPVDSKNS